MRYEAWAFQRLRERPRCQVEPSMTCIPLRNDPICTACYEGSQTQSTETDGLENPEDDGDE